MISCLVPSVWYRESKEEERRKKEEGKVLHGGRYFPNFYTNDTNGHDMNSQFSILNLSIIPVLKLLLLFHIHYQVVTTNPFLL